jgi:DNA-binding LytR/AlgR family response regulator
MLGVSPSKSRLLGYGHVCHHHRRHRAFHRADLAHPGGKTPFLRCRRQYMVNPEQIKEISFLETSAVEILTRNNRRIPVSRRLLGELKEKLGLA